MPEASPAHIDQSAGRTRAGPGTNPGLQAAAQGSVAVACVGGARGFPLALPDRRSTPAGLACARGSWKDSPWGTTCCWSMSTCAAVPGGPISGELSGIFARLGSSAESWWARLEKLSRGRLLGRFFAASRDAAARSREPLGPASPGQPGRMPGAISRLDVLRLAGADLPFGTRLLRIEVSYGTMPDCGRWRPA